jgi:CO dehydrogenase maturation factor
MKIAFVGKGGSGKSTMTGLFIRYLENNNKPVLAIDADLNMNLSGLLGAKVNENIVLANPEIADNIRTHLKGNNKRIQSTADFLPTTMPATGSNIINTYNDKALMPYAISTSPTTNLLTVGTYDSEGIGQTCYHSHLFVAENLLSHTVTNENFNVVCDMVAGTDAFAYSLHLQFDAIILIAEPTPESVEVCKLYMNLAVKSGTDKNVFIIGNKIEDEDDLTFIRQNLEHEIIGYVPKISSLKKMRQNNMPLKDVPEECKDLMTNIEHKAKNPLLSEEVRFNKLRQLHEKLNDKKWVQLAYGDVMNQIDYDFDMKKVSNHD